MLGVFIYKEGSDYKDEPDQFYQFPKGYYARAKSFEGGWALYYEPTKVKNTRGYFAVAKVARIKPDENFPGRFLSLIEPGSYTEFANPVPFKKDGLKMERDVVNSQWSVRPISETDFNRILDYGMGYEDFVLPRSDDKNNEEFQEQQTLFEDDPERRRKAYLTNRAVRDRNFRKNVLNAYGNKCAFTGLGFINGGGRAEVQAAHIKPVEHNGPDRVRNGLALSGTVHWMFDRGLLSVADNMEIMVSRYINDTESVEKLINSNGRASTPDNPQNAPHTYFLKWHRENCFKF